MPLHDAYTVFEGPWGPMQAACRGEMLTGLWFAPQAHAPNLAEVPRMDKHPLWAVLKKELKAYHTGRLQHFTVPLQWTHGSAFAQAVWTQLRTVPWGQTISYGALAKLVSTTTGRHASARAVGGAVGRNPISIVVPCHRVVGANGSLTGYAGGLDKKIAFLRLENSLG